MYAHEECSLFPAHIQNISLSFAQHLQNHAILSLFWGIFCCARTSIVFYLGLCMVCSIYRFAYTNLNTFYACTGREKPAAQAIFCIVIYAVTRKKHQTEHTEREQNKIEMRAQSLRITHTHARTHKCEKAMSKSRATHFTAFTAFLL